MATLTAGAGSTTWTSAAFSGGAASTAADEVVVPTGASLTISSANTVLCRSLSVTGTGTLIFAATTSVVTIGDATAGTGNVALSVAGTATLTLTGIGTMNFVSTNATVQTITSGGKTLPAMTFNGVGGSWQLADNLTTSGNTTLTNGTFDTNSKTVTSTRWLITTAGTRTLTMGSSLISSSSSINAFNIQNAGGLTITANTAIITATSSSASMLSNVAQDMNGASAVFNGGGQMQLVGGGIWQNVTVTGTANKSDTFSVGAALTVNGTFTVSSNSSVNRIMVASNVRGTAFTITAAAVVLANVVDFMDITGAGAATWTTAGTGATLLGDAGGNSGITFSTPATQTMTAAGSWSDITKWTSRVPLPQDDVVITGSNAVTVDMPRMGKSLDFSGYSGAMTLTTSATAYDVFGSVTLGASQTWGSAPNTFNLNLSGRSSYTITSNGNTFFPAGSNATLALNCPSGTYTLADNLSYKAPTTAQFQPLIGTFVSANKTLDIGRFTMGAGTKTLTFGTSIINLNATNATSIVAFVASGLTLSAASATFTVATTSTNTRSIDFVGQTIGTFNYTVAGSTGQLTVTSSFTANIVNWSDITNARTVVLTIAVIVTILNGTSSNWTGSSGKLTTLTTTVAGTPAVLNIISGGRMSNDWMSIKDLKVNQPYMFFAGANSTSVSGNTNVNLTVPPTAPLVRQAAYSNNASSVTSLTFTYPATTTSGQLLVCQVGYAANPGTVTPPTGWTLAKSVTTNAWNYTFYKLAAGTETTVQPTWVNSVLAQGLIYELSGFTGTPTLDTTDSNNSASAATLSTGAGATNTSAPAVALAGVAGGGGLGAETSLPTNSYEHDTGITLDAGNVFRTALLPLTTTASQTTIFAWTTTRNSASALVIFTDVASVVTVRSSTMMLMGVG